MFPAIVIILLVTSTILYVIAPHPPRTPKQADDLTELELFLDRLVQSGNPPGLSLVVVANGKIVYNKAFGYADGPKGKKTEPDTVYHWWSMTKIPTTIAIMQLHEQGKLNLEDPVIKHLPWFDVIYPSDDGPVITIQHLLQHTSGLPDTIPAMIGWVHFDDALRNQTEVLKLRLPEFNKLRFIPGEKAAYSNLNYMVLGAIIESVSGQSYETYIDQNILQPLGMSQTGFVYTSTMAMHEAAGTLPLAHYYTPLLPILLDTKALIRERQENLLWLERVYIDATPPTGLIGSSTDVGRLMMAYLNDGSLDGSQILTPDSVTLMTETAPVNGRGLGWFINGTNDLLYLEHAGGGPGFATMMRLYPERNLGFVILANGTDLDREGLMDLLANMSWQGLEG